MSEPLYLIAKNTPKPPPAPGIYRDLKPEEYFSYAAASGSLLENVAGSKGSPAAAFVALSKEFKPSAAMKEGRLAHFYFLEPDVWNQLALPGPFNHSLKPPKCYGKGTGKWAAFEIAHPDRLVYDPDDLDGWDTLKAHAEADPNYQGMMAVGEASELSMFWTEDVTLASGEVVSVAMKARADHALIDRAAPLRFIHDLKFTCHPIADMRRLQREITDRGIYRRAAIYLRGVQMLTYEPRERGAMPTWVRSPRERRVEQFTDWLGRSGVDFVITFLCKDPKHGHGVLSLPLDHEAIACGFAETYGGKWNHEDQPGSLERYAEALHTGEWRTHRLREHETQFEVSPWVYAMHERNPIRAIDVPGTENDAPPAMLADVDDDDSDEGALF